MSSLADTDDTGRKTVSNSWTGSIIIFKCLNRQEDLNILTKISSSSSSSFILIKIETCRTLRLPDTINNI